MGKENITIAIHNETTNQQKPYNVLQSFSNGLLQGFTDIGVKAYTTDYCFENNINFNISIGFDTDGIKTWQKILSNNVTNVMWSTDSVFGKNNEVINQFSTFDKFVLFESTPADAQAIDKYLPNIKHGYIPIVTDLNLWKKNNNKKVNDIVFFSSICDYEEIYNNLKEKMPELVYNLMMQIRELAIKYPQLTFWQISETIRKSYELEFDKEQYTMLFKNLVYAIEAEQKVKMIQALSNLNVTVYGNELWKKYVNGKVEYKGNCSVEESVAIMEQSKISLHNHPIRLGLGIHERILNASAIETFTLSGDTPSLKVEFGDALGYYNNTTFEDIEEKANYYLTNEDERQEIAMKAHKTTAQNHTWKNRAQSIIDTVE